MSAARPAGPGFPPPALDSVLAVETPEGIEFTLFPAGPVIRSCAWAIDMGIQWLLILVVAAASNFLEEGSGSWGTLLLFFCIDWFYHVGWEACGRGQSPGKRLMGIRVVRGDGSPVNPGASFLRNLLRFADTFLFLCPIALVTMLVSRGCRRLGDWVGDTLVVYTARSLPVSVLSSGMGAIRGGGRGAALSRETALSSAPAGESVLSSGFAGGAALSGEEKQGILMFVRRYPLLGKARADEIAAPYVRALRDSACRDAGGIGEAGGIGDGGDGEPGDEPGTEDALPFLAAEYLLEMGRKMWGDP
jgi:uncharacterized RDD family membrane protein YckC